MSSKLKLAEKIEGLLEVAKAYGDDNVKVTTVALRSILADVRKLERRSATLEADREVANAKIAELGLANARLDTECARLSEEYNAYRGDADVAHTMLKYTAQQAIRQAKREAYEHALAESFGTVNVEYLREVFQETIDALDEEG